MNYPEDQIRAQAASPRLLDDESNAYQLSLKNRALGSSTEGITISDPSLQD